jgi:hypothetical protein
MTEEEGPESPIPAGELQSNGARSFQDAELVTEGEDLCREGGSRGSEGNQGNDNESGHREHADKIPGRGPYEGASAQIPRALS